MASTLRRRVVVDDAPFETTASESATPTPADEIQILVPEDKVKVVHHHRPKTRKRRSTAIFLLGSLCGIIAAGFFARSNDLIDLPELGELSMDSLFDVLPAGLVKDVRELVIGERDFLQSYDAFSVGVKAREEGLEAHHPVVLVPGVISTGLESWGVLWGSWSMMRALVLDKENWKNHIMLDKQTGMDPPGIKLRAAQGFDATDFFITGYWIWNKIIENLASLGYDPMNSYTAAYDWRLAYKNLETRDQYFTRLKAHIELAVKLQDKKVVLASHSMGSQVVFYFFHWVGSRHGGNGGDDWVEKHIDSWINVSGCMLGAVKDVSAILSGEMRDTAQLNAFAVYGLEKFLSKSERAEIFRAMPGMSSMLPIGGSAIWGNLTSAPDDQPGQPHSFGSFLNFRTTQNFTSIPSRNFTVDDAMAYLLATTEDWYVNLIKSSYSWGVAHTTAAVNANEDLPHKWINPSKPASPSPLPSKSTASTVSASPPSGGIYRSPNPAH
ncbi:phospholipid:diacylglycerol acyltransferase [Collariella sp. IMI 366227]|nr:phospholipid:diacylglycerol acyltransferase [Collariella sp. IMI 366227]